MHRAVTGLTIYTTTKAQCKPICAFSGSVKFSLLHADFAASLLFYGNEEWFLNNILTSCQFGELPQKGLATRGKLLASLFEIENFSINNTEWIAVEAMLEGDFCHAFHISGKIKSYLSHSLEVHCLDTIRIDLHFSFSDVSAKIAST